ncbi:acyl-CoA thioesterase [Mycolicibacterium vaccae]|uniref:acyl-CoA thioesterase n=1 Tax=Mycolicibacterium vaccae TaxID=1810 RepID=UPI003D081559
MMTTHPFDDALTLEATEARGVWRGHTNPAWANMVGPFGGVTAAVLLRAVETHPDRMGEPVSLTVNFVAPVADGAFDVSTRVVRTNRSNQHWLVELAQDGEVKTNATAVFTTRRDTWTDTEAAPPRVPAPESVARSEAPGLVQWISNFDMRYIEGDVPGPDAGPAPSSETALWVRDRRDRPLDFAALTALSDIFYPRVFLRRGAVGPAGTVSMTIYFHAEGADLAGLGADFLLATTRANRFGRGYFDQSAALWSRSGDLLVTTHQLVYFRA